MDQTTYTIPEILAVTKLSYSYFTVMISRGLITPTTKGRGRGHRHLFNDKAFNRLVQAKQISEQIGITFPAALKVVDRGADLLSPATAA